MTDEKKEGPKLSVVKNLNEAYEEENKIPKEYLDKLRSLIKKAEEGKLKHVIIHYVCMPEEDEEDEGATIMYHRDNNGLELLGTTEVIKSLILGSLGGQYEEE